MKCDFIEIGTSNFNTLIQSCENHETGLCVEPLEFYLNDLPNKPNVIKVPVAISDSVGSMDLYYVSPENIDTFIPKKFYGLKGCNSLGKPHPSTVRKLKEYNLMHLYEKKQVSVITFGDLLEKYNVESIGFLKIDTEGMDCIILKSMIKYFEEKNISKDSPLWPKKILFETNVLTDNNTIESTIENLKRCNYFIQSRNNEDTTMVRKINEKSSSTKTKKRILILAYDILDKEKWPCGQRALDLYELLKNFKDESIELEVAISGYKLTVSSITQFFERQWKPDIIISQQFATENAKHICSVLCIPLIVLIHYNTGEYNQFFSLDAKLKKDSSPLLVFGWTNSLTDALKNITRNVPVISLNEMENKEWLTNKKSSFWDLLLYKISIIVPCHDKHVSLLQSLFENFLQFREKPFEIIISVSVEQDQLIDNVQKLISKVKEDYEKYFRISISLSFQPKTASENRNLAAQQSQGDILLFLDSDDKYHPQLLEIVKYMWKKHKPVELHWQFIHPDPSNTPPEFNKEYTLDLIDIIEGEKVHEIQHPNGVCHFNIGSFKGSLLKPSVVMGHVAVDKKVWEEHPWPNIIGAEDTLYHQKNCWYYPTQSIWLKCILSFYQLENSLR